MRSSKIGWASHIAPAKCTIFDILYVRRDLTPILIVFHSRRQGSERNSDSESLSTLNDAPPRATTAMASTPSSFVPARTKPLAPKARARAGRERRSVIPDRPDLPINLWSIMKNCIGKELSKIPMPVSSASLLSVGGRLTRLPS